MRTFVVFDKRTGEIIATHVQTDNIELHHRDLLTANRPELSPEDLDVMTAEGLEPAVAYRVDLNARKLVPVEGVTRASGGAFVQQLGGDPASARTVVVNLRSERVEGRPH